MTAYLMNPMEYNFNYNIKLQHFLRAGAEWE